MKKESEIFDYEGLPKPQEKEGFGNDFVSESNKWRAEEKSKARIINGCYSKDVES